MKMPDWTLVRTCTACPEQYDLLDEGGNCLAYFRLRHGYFFVECPYLDGELVYEAYPDGDGSFMPYEREEYMRAAMDAVKKYYGWEAEDGTRDGTP